MPAYHSSLTSSRSIGNIALLPLNTKCRGPALSGDGGKDVVDESIGFFKANIFFKSYEIKSEADRVVIYITLYITECLKKLQRCSSAEQGRKEMHSLAISNFGIPGDATFPLNA
ncbi:hypothetical protein, partial [Salmonella sp. s51944]|uniref:hypothetical protein n=1 Tax=Salmonella sp. s51944 TaxID=3159655 RepID=UPI003980C105